MVITETSLPSVLKLLAEPTRLRILALLEREELSVGELSRALGMAQSRVSNHLRLLRDAELLAERHSGSTNHLSLAGGSNGNSPLLRLWIALRDELETLPEHKADLVRLESVLDTRRAKTGDFFDRVAGQWDTIAGDFQTGHARLRAGTHLLPPDLVVADLGCGTGYMTHSLLGQCSRMICVDRSERMLEEARKNLSSIAHVTELEFRQGELDSLPIKDDEVDGVMAGMVLHHLAHIESAISEMYRILKPGGTAATVEMDPHHEDWMRDELGDRHLGLDSSDVVAAFRRAGFSDVVLEPVDDHYQPVKPDGETVSLSLYIVRGRVPRTVHK